jgi:aldose sugar dehydrogenase
MRTTWTYMRSFLAVAAVGLASLTGVAQQQTPAPGAQQTPPGGGRQGGGPGGGRQAGPQGFPRVPTLPFPDAPEELDTVGPKIRVVPLFKGLANPWSIAFLPNGDVLITERPGRLRIARNGALDPQAITGVPQVWAVGQGGLLEVLPHPRFAENRYLYLTYSKQCEKSPNDKPAATTALARGTFDGKALTEVRDLFVADNCNSGNPHFGSKLAWGRDGMLYMTIGERGDRNRAQNTNIHGGKVLRLREDGTAAPDNPFVGKPDHKPEIYSYGHRNPQGLAFHPDTGALWENEHGPQGGDELNIVLPGKNYGWPIASYGREYPPDGARVSASPSREGVEEPLLLWIPSIGISGMTFYTGDKFPQWKGNVFVGGLSGLAVHRIGFNEKQGLMGRETLLEKLRQRIRDVRQGPDGFLYLAVDANPGGILRVEPAQSTTTSSNGR